MNSNDLWETHAEWWIREFTDGADPEYEEQILPMVLREVEGATRVLDLGCGEGQISRALAASGVPTVIGIDPTYNQIEVARQRGGVFALHALCLNMCVTWILRCLRLRAFLNPEASFVSF